MKNLSVYIHIPFCRSKCKYCRFASFSWLKDIEIKKYISFLIKEIQASNYKTRVVDTIYFWGGTPWLLDLESVEEIIKTLKNSFVFDDNIEISFESNPANISKEYLEWLKKIWINRLSIWVQTLNEKALKEIGRQEKWSIKDSFDIIKDSGLENSFIFSLDFIIWLPFVESWEIKKDIEYILDNYDFVKHISIYMLEEYYKIPEQIESKFENITYPDSWHNLWIQEEDYLKEYSQVKELLSKKWFNRYEISNFALDWFLCKHNYWYWQHKEYIWFWAWAHSFVNKARFWNSEILIEYYSWKKSFEEILNGEDLFLEKIIFDLRTTWIEKKDLERLNREELERFVSDWYLLDEKWKIKLTDKWILLLDYILENIV